MPGTRNLKSKRQKHSPSSQWSVTFAGLMAAMMTFFIVLISISQVNQTQFQLIASALREAFGVGHGEVVTAWKMSDNSSGNDSGGSGGGGGGQQLDRFEFERSITLVHTKETLRNSLANTMEEGKTFLSETDEGFLIQIDTDLLFKRGTMHLHPIFRPKLFKMAQLFAELPNLIYITGHTDSRPSRFATPLLSNNWSLSAQHAATVAQYFVEQGGIDGQRVQIRGMAQFSPKDPNEKDISGHQRRVEILVSNNFLLKPSDTVNEQAVIVLAGESYGMQARVPKSLRMSQRLWNP